MSKRLLKLLLTLPLLVFVINTYALWRPMNPSQKCFFDEQDINICAVDTTISGRRDSAHDPYYGFLNCKDNAASNSNMARVCIKNRDSECVYKMDKVSPGFYGGYARFLDENGIWQECTKSAGYCVLPDMKCPYTDYRDNAVLCSYKGIGPNPGCDRYGICNDGAGIGKNQNCEFTIDVGQMNSTHDPRDNQSCYKKELYNGDASQAPISLHNYSMVNCPIYVCSSQHNNWVYRGSLTITAGNTGPVRHGKLYHSGEVSSYSHITITTEKDCVIGG